MILPVGRAVTENLSVRLLDNSFHVGHSVLWGDAPRRWKHKSFRVRVIMNLNCYEKLMSNVSGLLRSGIGCVNNKPAEGNSKQNHSKGD